MAPNAVTHGHQAIVDRFGNAPIGHLIGIVRADVHIERSDKAISVVPVLHDRQKTVIDVRRLCDDIGNLLRLIHISTRVEQCGPARHRKRHVNIIAVQYPIKSLTKDIAVSNQRVRRKMHIACVGRSGNDAVHVKGRASSQMHALIEQHLALPCHVNERLVSRISIIADDGAWGVGFKDRVGR